jgi:hypothetical protein
MEIENDWASPTIGDIRLPDRDLGRRLTAAVVFIAVISSMLALRSVSRLPVQIARNDAATAAHYRVLARLSPSRSLLGYRVRFILIRHAAVTVFTVAIVTSMARGL